MPPLTKTNQNNKHMDIFNTLANITRPARLKEFTIWTPNKFGIGCKKIKARSFADAFLRLSNKDRMKQGWIDDENGKSLTFNQILGIEE